MANDEKAFAALLSQAPLYQKSETVTLTGSLARSPEKGKFALMQSDGSVITLDIDAVKSHTVIGNSFGQQIVQVELDAKRIPKETTEQPASATPFYSSQTGSPASLDVACTGWVEQHKPLQDLIKNLQDHPFTLPYLDQPQSPSRQMLPYVSTILTHGGHPDVISSRKNSFGPSDIPVRLQPDYSYVDHISDYQPFLLVTGHQAPANALNQI